MSRIKKTSPKLNLTRFQTFLVDNKENSEYFKLSEFPDELTSGKNGFLIEGSQYLKPTTEIKIEVTDTDGNPLYVEPGEGVPKYYEGLSKLVSIHVYENTPIGIGKITILGELETYIDENGVVRNIPDEWSGIYNIKWEKDLKINKNLLNETRVRFVKRPQILIEELGESFYDKIITKSTQNSGTIQGIAVQPPAGTNLNNYAGGITYYLKNESIPFADGAKEISIEGTQIQSASIVEYINQYTLAVRVPHTSSNRIVSDFTNKNYSLNYEYVSNTTESSVFGSFARFEINNLKTFVGDVERIKVFAKSNSSVEDFNLLYDARVNSSNLLETIISGSIIQRGNFSASYGDSRTWNTYWATESLNGLSNISLDSDNLYKSVKFRNYKIKTNVGNDIRLEKGSEYTIELNVLYNTPTQNYNPNKNDLLKIYAASSQKNTGLTSIYVLTSSLDTLVANNTLKTPTKLFYNFIPELTDDWNINFEAINDDSNTFWQIGGIKIYGSNELGYSPDEFAFIVPLQRTLEQENFDFRLEYFDLNNNFVPIQNITSQTFVSGNLSLLGKNIDVSSDKIFFSFDGNESPTPSDQVITISANKTKILGSLLISSEAFDSGGAYIPPVSFGANPYPGNLSSKYETSTLFSASLSIADFTGSLYGAPPTFGNINVDRILYTFSDSSIQPVVKKISIGRILQGTGSAGAAGSDAKTVNLTTNIFTIPYDGDGIEIGTNNIFLTASQQNHVGTIYYEFLKNGVSKQNTTSEYYTVLSVDEPTTSSVDLWRVNTREGSSGGTVIAFDSINLFGVKAGSDSYTIVLSNESHTLPTTNTGIVNYTGSGTDIQVYKGADELSGILSGTPTLGQFSASYNVTNGSISVGAVSLSGNKIRFNSHSAMGTDSSTIAYVIYLEGLNTNFVKVQSLAKSFEGNDGANGSDGTDAKVISLSSDKYTFTYNGDNVRTPLAQTASLTGSAQNIAIPYYQFYKNNILKSPANYTSPYWIITGSEIPSAGTRDLWEVRVWDGIPAGGALAFDNIDIFGLKDGGDAKTVDLASPNYIIVYDKNGQNPTPSLLFPVTASARNFASPLFKFTGDVDSPEISYTVGSSSNADTASFTPPSSFFTTPKQLRVGVSENSNPTVEVAFDTITIAAVRPGLDGISGSSSTFYYIKPLNGTQIKNSQGTLEIQAIKVSGSTSFNLNSGSVVLTTGSSANSVLQSGNGVTAGSNGVSFNAILNSSAINGSRTIILKDTGSNEVYDTVTLIDVTDGVSAGSGIADTLVFRREINNTYTPATASLTASFFSTNGLEYQERYKVYAYFNGIQDQMYATLEADSPYITSSIDNGDGTKIGLQFTNRTTTKDLNFTFEFRDPQINETSSFTETMYIVSDGIDGDDGYTVQLTNDNHSVPVSNDNPPVFDYAGSGTQIIAYRGAAQLNSTTSTPTSGTFSASFAVTNGNITVGAFDVSGFPIVIGDHSNLTTNAATITYTVNLEGSASLTRVQSINRATEGDDGFSVYLTNDSDTYPADQDGIVQRLSILGLYTEVNVFKGTTQYVYNQLGGANTYKTGSIVSSSNITISQSIVNNNVRITPTSATGSTQITGSVLIPIVTGSLTFNRTYTFGISKAGTSGSNALSIVLSPTNQTVSKSQAGSYGRPVTFSLQVFETGSPLLYTGSNNTLQSGYFTIFAPSAAGTLVPATGSISASIVPPLVISDSGVTSSFSVVYRDSKGNLSSYISQSHRVAVVSDGINGASGSDSKTISLFSDRYTFTYDQNGILTPLNSQTASLTASAQTGSVNWGADIYYQFQKNGTTVSPANWSTPFWIVTSSVGASSIPSAGGIDIWQVNLLSGSGQVFVASDSTDLFGLKSGSDAYTVFLTNESHVFSANELGVVPSSEYSGGATQVRFFRGTTQYTYDQVAPYNTNSYRTGSAIYSFNITASSATVNNDLQLTPIAVTGSTGQLSGSIVLPIIDNATNVTFSKTYTFSISKAGSSGSNALSILLNPTNQVVTKSQAGTYQRPVTFSIQVFETGSPLLYTGSNNTLQSGYFTIYAQTANAMGTLIPATASISASIIPPIVTTDSGTTSSFALQYRDSKGTLSNWISQSHRINVVTDGRDGVSGSNAIDWWMAPNTQTVTASLALGTYSTASRFNVYVFETGSPMRYTTSDPPTTRGTWTIVMSTIGSNGTNNSTNNEISGTVTPPLPTAIRPFTSSFQLRYLDSKGNLSNYISQSHVINVVSVGQTGPGIVFTGPWTSGRTYQYSEGSSNGRRDAVISGSSNRYYATLQQHISDGTNFPTDGSSNAFWQFLGNEDFFVAAKIAIFEESYVQNTLNIGTTNYEAGFSSANITLAGGTQYPFISIGQTAANYNNPGIWIGNRTGSFVASFQSTGGSFLKWDGSQLFISGNISASIGRIGGVTISSQSLFIGEGGYDNTNTGFFVSSSGDFSLKNSVVWNNSAGTFDIRNGSLNLAGGTGTSTNINNSGLLNAQNAIIGGTITATNGNIGGWSISDNFLQAGSTSVGTIKLDKSRPAISLFSGSQTSPAVEITTVGEFSNTGSLSIGLTGSDSTKATSVSITTAELEGSSNNNTGGNISSQYTGLSISYSSGSTSRLEGSAIATFTIDQGLNNKTVTLNFGNIGYNNGVNTGSIFAEVDSNYYISNASFNMRYGFALYSSSTSGDVFIDSVSKSGTGQNTLSNSNRAVRSGINYSGTLSLIKTLKKGDYKIKPFVDLISVNIDSTEIVGGGGCNCPSNGTFAYYGACDPVSGQEVYRYDGTCDGFGNCNVVLTYENSNCY